MLGLWIAALAVADPAALPPPPLIVDGIRNTRFAAPRVPDGELARMRGGLRLPNGLDVSLGIDIQTWVDGQLALRSTFSSDGPAQGIRVYSGGSGPPDTTGMISRPATQDSPQLTIDRSPTGTTILPSSTTTGAIPNIAVGSGSGQIVVTNGTPVPVSPNGPAIATPAGEVSLSRTDAGSIVALHAPGLDVQHLIGRATGVTVANTANDRVIQTISSVNVDLKGLSPALMAGTFQAQRAALQTALSRGIAR